MTKTRAPIKIDGLDTIKPGTAARRPDRATQATQDATAEAQGFTSREGVKKGRTKRKALYPVQFNLKVREEDKETFLEIAEDMEVPNGKVFALMVEAYLQSRRGQ